MKPDSTYDRKYYLIRKIERAGFTLSKTEGARIINVPHDLREKAEKNRAVRELRETYQYGVQLLTIASHECTS